MSRTHRFSRLWFGAAFALIASLVPLGTAGANHNTDATKYQSVAPITVTPLSSPTANWSGTTATGANANYSFESGEPCHHPNPVTDPDPRKCDILLLRVDLSEAPTYWDTFNGGVEVSIDNYSPDTASDYDLQAYLSDSAGRKLPGPANRVGSSGAVAGQPERLVISEPNGYYLIQVVYFAVVQSNYQGHIRFVPRQAPPDVDSPPGLQEVLASDPSQGWLSRSEMHIAQNPVNPNYLIAGSKFYNKDPDSLAQYEFKVGSYVSFDRGRTWSDLGQVRTAPASAACAQNWPNNTCYPEDDPAANDDPGEQYITSDPWVGWDDEGNAYYMMLDSPPFPATDNGWGMSFHRWDNVSPADVTAGDTWGPKKIISSYQTGAEQGIFLDDKNTFAVNNAGPDGDGQTGVIVACWGLNIAPASKQAEVCRRSTDKGETWPVQFERVINDAEQLGIGVHVVADEFDANTFYAAYLQYATTLPGEGVPATIEFNKTVDASLGFNWLPVSTTVAAIDDIPRQFPGQSFRNLSIPIMAAGRRMGSVPLSELYITWAEERVTPESGGQKEAEIALVRSDDAGATWGGFGTWNPGQVASPHIKVVNGPDSGRSQFQPYVDITPLGQVNVLYFDRRHDPSDYFVDTYLSRSMNRGVTFTDHRLSHDATDPEFNAPISPNGKFFGDYQGLVVDNCFAYPFVNDTHLANDAFLDPGPGPRDPDFDFGMPDSAYQEAVTWRVPNSTAFGGVGPGCGHDLVLTKTDSNDSAPTGRNLTYTLTVTNNGPDPASDVVVVDTLPGSVTFVSANSSQGTCAHLTGVVTCNVGSMANGAVVTITIVVRPTQAGVITNVASVTASTEELSPGNNSDSEDTTICRITSRRTSIPCD
jgi:uncharacterized repeat protein (TIGR01451 family)